MILFPHFSRAEIRSGEIAVRRELFLLQAVPHEIHRGVRAAKEIFFDVISKDILQIDILGRALVLFDKPGEFVHDV